MSLYDFFFPEQAQASHLRSIANSQRVRNRPVRRKRPNPETANRLESLEEDIGYLALMMGAIINKIDEKGVVTREELKDVISELDGLDGVQDGKLNIDILKGINY